MIAGGAVIQRPRCRSVSSSEPTRKITRQIARYSPELFTDTEAAYRFRVIDRETDMLECLAKSSIPVDCEELNTRGRTRLGLIHYFPSHVDACLYESMSMEEVIPYLDTEKFRYECYSVPPVPYDIVGL